MPSCLPTTGKDDTALASWIHDGGQHGHKAEVGVLPADSFQSTRVTVANLDQINILTC